MTRVSSLVALALFTASPVARDVVARDFSPASGQNQRRPQRIVSIVPAVTEMLFAIGAGDQVVGVSSFDTYPPEARARTRIGALVDPDIERMLSLEPDLAIVYGTQSDLIERLARAGVPMFNYQHAGLPDVTKTIVALGERVGRPAEAAALAARIDRDISEVRTRVQGRARPRTAVIIAREPGAIRGVYANGGVGFLHDMLEAAGGAEVFADVRRENLQVSIEVLLARAPEVILEVHPAEGWTPERIARERGLWLALTGLPAVKNNRVHFITDSAVLVPGPRVAEGIRMMADALHPGRYAAPANSTGTRVGISFFSNASSKKRTSAARPRSP